ncbi:polysaccharide deacetylase family protein [Haliea sp.]|uniref:polysaccharide deacetylase family protein n=1 Tax=Haliea sp. TaxID=1932666 RepID=UPI0025BE9838|nr:polysaccharide deacetylase family protein [Haliea sp.]
MSKCKFQRRMELLKELGYPVITLTEALEKHQSGELPKGATVITIDDGWQSTYEHMLPVLQALNYPATVYLTTYYCFNQLPVIDVALQYSIHQIDPKRYPLIHVPEYGLGPLPTRTHTEKKQVLAIASKILASLDSDSAKQLFLRSLCQQTGLDYEGLAADRLFHLMTPMEVKETAESGIAVELHTHHHRITHNDEDCLEHELAINSERIQAITGRVPTHFCYPSGRFSPEIWPTLRRTGIASATTTDIGLVNSQSERYALPRILDGQNVSELEFEAEMSGFMELIRHARNLFRSPA